MVTVVLAVCFLIVVFIADVKNKKTARTVGLVCTSLCMLGALGVLYDAHAHFRKDTEVVGSQEGTPGIESAEPGHQVFSEPNAASGGPTDRFPVVKGVLQDGRYEVVASTETGSFVIPFKQNITGLPAGSESYVEIQFKDKSSVSGVREWSSAHLYTSDLTAQQVSDLQSR